MKQSSKKNYKKVTKIIGKKKHFEIKIKNKINQKYKITKNT